MVINDKYIKILYNLVLKSFKKGEIPVGSIVIYNNKVIGKGYNTRQKSHLVFEHAEVNAIKQASKYLKDWRLDNCVLISTLKPCNMCSSIIKESRIKEVYYFIDQNGVLDNSYIKINSNNDYIKSIYKIFNEFFKKMRS